MVGFRLEIDVRRAPENRGLLKGNRLKRFRRAGLETRSAPSALRRHLQFRSRAGRKNQRIALRTLFRFFLFAVRAVRARRRQAENRCRPGVSPLSDAAQVRLIFFLLFTHQLFNPSKREERRVLQRAERTAANAPEFGNYQRQNQQYRDENQPPRIRREQNESFKQNCRVENERAGDAEKRCCNRRNKKDESQVGNPSGGNPRNAQLFPKPADDVKRRAHRAEEPAENPGNESARQKQHERRQTQRPGGYPERNSRQGTDDNRRGSPAQYRSARCRNADNSQNDSQDLFFIHTVDYTASEKEFQEVGCVRWTFVLPLLKFFGKGSLRGKNLFFKKGRRGAAPNPRYRARRVIIAPVGRFFPLYFNLKKLP